MIRLQELAHAAARGVRLDDTEAQELAQLSRARPEVVAEAARARSIEAFGPVVTYSKKVFIPLTKLCRDTCGYCTFVHPPRAGERGFMTLEEVVEVARAGEAAGCKEALFTLGEKPERKWPEARNELRALGHETTIEYLAQACATVLEETSLLPHVNPGTMSLAEVELLRTVSVSQGMMLETTSKELLKRGRAHFGAPDKKPAVRLATLEAAGRRRRIA